MVTEDFTKLPSKFRGEDPRVPGFVDSHFAPPLKVMFIGAHPDDPDVRCSGFARTLVEAGHRVRYVSLSNGDKGHQFMDSPALAKRRYGESRKVIATLGIEDYLVADTPDCEIEVTLAARKWVTRVIREFGPHIIVTHRPNDYHCDHRATATLARLAEKNLPELIRLMRTFDEVFRADWYRTSQPFGYELIQKRNAAQLARLEEARRRLGDWLAGRAKTIEELDETLRPFGLFQENGVVGW